MGVITLTDISLGATNSAGSFVGPVSQLAIKLVGLTIRRNSSVSNNKFCTAKIKKVCFNKMININYRPLNCLTVFITSNVKYSHLRSI